MAEERAGPKAEKSLWGFQPDDVILRVVTKEGASVFQPFTVVTVLDEKQLLVENNEGVQTRIASPQNVMLYKRPYFPYKVKDKVKALKGSMAGYEGLVVLLNPYSNEMLVDFSEFNSGHQGENK